MRISSTRLSKLFLLALIALASVSATLATSSVAAKSTMTFNFLAGTGFLCGLATNACPDVATTSSGDTVWITGSGTLSVFPKSVSGNGTFTHKNPDGTVRASGTWTATQLVEFVSYGNATPTLFGGRALIMVTLFIGSTAVHTALLQITCRLGNPPTGVDEGIRLNVQGTPFNFNDEVSGFTVFSTS